MPLVMNYLIVVCCIAAFVGGYRWLMNLFRRRAAPHPVTYRQRWLVGFVSILPLCLFAGYAVFHSHSFAVLLSIGFGLGGAALAAASGLPVIPFVGREPKEPAESYARRPGDVW